MWEYYFGKQATIIGIDINPDCKLIEKDNIFIEIGDQSNINFLQNIIEKYGRPDIILDDGSHVSKHQIDTFNFLYYAMKDEGIYLVEDTHTSYWKEWGGGLHDPLNFIEFSKSKIDELRNLRTPGSQEELNKIYNTVKDLFEKGKIDKVKAEKFYKSFGLPVTILRPFNTYGPRQSARAVIPTIISQLVSKNKFIKIGNLKPTRDFTYVDDTVEAFILALKKNISGEVINIGNKFEISIKGILDIFKNDFNYDFKIVIDEKRVRSKKSEVFRLLASDFKAKKLLQWKPRYQGIDGFKKGLAKTIEWFNKPDNIRLYKSDIYNM
jgi:hypothetical protein